MDKNLVDFEANFSVLDRYGTYVTNEDYVTDPAIGRDQQIKELILILLTPEKSAILIGKPGIGKTAIVEGLAYRIQKNLVPEALKGYEIINIKTASLLGTMPSGESKVQKMIDELKTKDKLILFIDEIHMLIGATDSSSLDFANIFKEGLGRGSIKVIGATTTEEYERYILRDKAFTRRFQKIDVPEPSREETIKIMMGTLPKFEHQTGRKMKYTPFIQERIMSFLVDITSEYKRVFALGSRYPDVCLTLLKQAFSYTVYDNRQYMDIFDVRKAIENSKNIYPDVIKKELPNFDKMFNDIILEENGEKPVEEWRKDLTPIRKDLDNGNDKVQEKPNNQISNNPELIERRDLDSQEINKNVNIVNKDFKSLKEIINKHENNNELDEMLLSSDVEVIKEKKDNGPKLPIQHVDVDEIKHDIDDSILLGKPIESTNSKNKEKNDNVVDTYKLDSKKDEGKKMWNNDNSKPERLDINSQNFDKYNNFFHRDDYSQNEERYENRKRMDMLMGNPYPETNNMAPNQMGQDDFGMQNNFDPMNGPMGPSNNFGPTNGPMGPSNNFGPTNGPMGPSNSFGPTNGPMGPSNNFGPMNGPMGPSNNFGPMNSPMGPSNNFGPMNNPNAGNNNFINSNNNQNEKETLFGAPMYSEPETNNFDNIPDPYNNVMNTIPQNYDNNMFDPQKPLNNQPTQSLTDSLFGAPMYGNPSTVQNNNFNVPDSNSFGPMISDNMRIKNGKIVDEFPTFDKIDNLSHIKTVINDVRDTNNGSNNAGGQSFLNMGGNLNNMPQNAMSNNNSGMSANVDANKKWTFIDNQPQNNFSNVQPTSSFLPLSNNDNQKPKEENTISTMTNSAEPTNNKDYYEDMKSGNFVNFSELSSGKIKEEDANKYMGVQTQEDKPKYDLNIENNIEEEDNKFDDFFE